MKTSVILLVLLLVSCGRPADNKVLIATASSFRPALESYILNLDQHCNTSTSISSGSTGALVTQIRQGAPFSLLVSADLQLSDKLAKNCPQCRIDQPMARSPMAFWRPDPDQPLIILAIANPDTAPFGKAAMELIKQGHIPGVSAVIRANNAAQAFAYVHSGSANSGYVPLSLLIAAEIPVNQYELVPQDQYSPILLQVVRLFDTKSTNCVADQLGKPEFTRRMRTFGYDTP